MKEPVITVLLVEDDPIHAKLIKRELHNFDSSIVIEHATSGEEAFECLEKSRNFDVIIANYDLPQKNGLEVLKGARMRFNFKKPFIMLIDHKYETVAMKALREGATHSIIKTEDYTARLPMVLEDSLKQTPVEKERVKVRFEYKPLEDLVHFTINGQAVVGQKNETVLDVARRYGIYIPTLCFHPSVTPWGACRICLVDVTVGKISRLYPSCMYPIFEGIIVKTDTEEVLEVRRTILELLMARCPDSDVLRSMADEMGIGTTRFAIRQDPDKCILCGLCVRVCEEVVGTSAISFSNRGIHRKIGTPFFELSDICTGCGECAKVCPTEAITLDYIDEKIRKKRKTRIAVKCDGCAGYPNRACVNNCPTGALKLMSIENFISKHQGSINVELIELLKYSLDEGKEEEKNA